MSNRDRKIRDRIAENDVTTMRSYLEVDVAEWLGDNEIPFGYEAFVIPSVVGPGKDRWDEVVEAIRAIGRGDRESVTLPDGEEMDAFDILDLWSDLYKKHKLAEEKVTIDPKPALAGFSKRMLLPDFALYLDAGVKTAEEDFEWGDYDYIVEVSGLYGVGLPDESEEDEWWDWYRVSAVAFKELAYRLLGLWDKVYWVIPNQAYIEGVTEGIPTELRNDDHYIIMNTTQAGIVLDDLADTVGVTGEVIEDGLSPVIEPVEYKRPLDSTTEFEMNTLNPVPYMFDGINMMNVEDNKNASILENDYIVFHGEMGEVYIRDSHARVRESMWRNTNMIMLREYILESLRELGENGIVEGLRVATR